MTRGAGFAAAAAIALVLALPFARADDVVAPPPPPDRAVSLAAWDQIYRVLQHPRCRNCHPAGDAPLQGDDGVPHAQNITRRSVKNGLPCTGCHRSKNARARRGPPGAPGWQLPPADHPLVFEGRSSAELCSRVKDPSHNGGMTVEGVAQHMELPLVKWAWDPGGGRSKPPISHQDFVDTVWRWLRNGAACP